MNPSHEMNAQLKMAKIPLFIVGSLANSWLLATTPASNREILSHFLLAPHSCKGFK